MAKVTYKEIKQSKEVNAYLERGNQTLGLQAICMISETVSTAMIMPIRVRFWPGRS